MIAGDPAQSLDLGAVSAHSPDGLFVISADGRMIWANAATLEVTGWGVEEIGRSVLEIVHPDDAMLALSSVETVQGKAVGTPVEMRVIQPDGSWRWIEVVGRDCTTVEGINGIVCTARDLTRRRMWEVEAQDVTRFQQVVQHAPAMLLLLSPDGRVTGVNGAFTRLLGHDPSVVKGAALEDFVTAADRNRLSLALAEAQGAGKLSVELGMVHRRQTEAVPIRLEIVNLADDPVVAGLIVTGHDMTQLHEARERLQHLATHDHLTGLPNRALLRDHLDALVAAGRPMTVLYVDLDHFKAVNDDLGHAAGDELLVHVARRLRGAVATGDIVARVGGDEFVVVACDVSAPATARALAARLSAAVAAPYSLQAGSATIGASVGFTVATSGTPAKELLLVADRMMYRTKTRRRANGRGIVRTGAGPVSPTDPDREPPDPPQLRAG